QAYSHSSSVGKRYNQPRPRSFSFSFLRNSCTSSHDTFSTGNNFSSSSAMSATFSFPAPARENQLGLLPITACHCPCVTGKTPSAKPCLISTCSLPGVPPPPPIQNVPGGTQAKWAFNVFSNRGGTESSSSRSSFSRCSSGRPRR